MRKLTEFLRPGALRAPRSNFVSCSSNQGTKNYGINPNIADLAFNY
jgi:hypothetical protein